MTDNIINFSDIVKSKNKKILEEDFWKNLDEIISETYDFTSGQKGTQDIPWPSCEPDEMEYILDNSPIVRITNFVITDLYAAGDDPSEQELSDDMIIIAMLYESAILESKTKSHKKSSGDLNAFYRHFDSIKKSMSKEEFSL
jgi:hypothetical protein